MKAGMFLAGLGSGVAQGYMLGKAAKKMDARAPGDLAPVRDSNPPVKVEGASGADAVADTAPAATPAVDTTPAAETAVTPPKKKVGTGTTQEDLVSEAEQYKKEWGVA